MAANHTGGASLRLGNVDRITPSPERNLIANMLGLITGMGIMTCCTGAPFRAVDMEEMQVIDTIPETCQVISGLALGYFLVVAAKAEIIVFGCIGGIKIHGIKPRQQFGVFRAMGIVTGSTVTGLYRPMPIFTGSNRFPQLGMAGEAHLLHGIFQEIGIIGRMGPVTGNTLPFAHRGMLSCRSRDGLVYFRTNLLVALGAERPAFFLQHIFRLRTVRIVTIGAIVFGRSMDILHGELSLAVIMTFETQFPIGRGGNKKFGIGGRMGAMTSNTITFFHRPMLILFLKNGAFVTGVAEGAYRIALTLELESHT